MMNDISSAYVHPPHFYGIWRSAKVYRSEPHTKNEGQRWTNVTQNTSWTSLIASQMITPDLVFNMDETCWRLSETPKKVLAEKGAETVKL
jgi:hypothetical protein